MTITDTLSPAIAVVDESIITRITQFLGYEALLLDNHRLEEWTALLDENILYEIPMRLATRLNSPDEFPAGAFRVRDNLAMIRKRMERAATGEGWSEDPPSRTVRNVSSIFVEATSEPDLFQVHSALTVYRQRALDRACDWIPARRKDIIRMETNQCTLVRRTVTLAETILQTPNLGIFL